MSTQSPPSTMALFGTSADPPTIGHQAILAGLAQRYPMVATWASDNPLKHHGAPLAVRCQLLQAVVDGLKTRIPQGRRLELRQDFSSSRAGKRPSGSGVFPLGPPAVCGGGGSTSTDPQLVSGRRVVALLLSRCRSTEQLAGTGTGHGTASGRRHLEALPLRIPSVASSQVRQRPDPALVPKDVLPVLASRGLYGFTAHDVRAHAARQ